MTREPAECWLCDLDGVLIRDDEAIGGAVEFVARLEQRGRPFCIITNNSMYTPEALCVRLGAMGFGVRREHVWTSALATATFAARQRPGGSAFLIGGESLTAAFDEVGYTLDATAPDYVVIGEPVEYSFERLTTAIRMVGRGAHLLATNPEPTGPSLAGPFPACGAVAALVERATGVAAYYVGKPNPLMVTEALAKLGARPSSTVVVGDRMETDVLVGVEAGLETILVLTGISSREDVARFAYQPTRVVDSVADLLDEL